MLTRLLLTLLCLGVLHALTGCYVEPYPYRYYAPRAYTYPRPYGYAYPYR